MKEDFWKDKFAGLLLESMAEGVFTLDSQGVITTWNPSMERITGYSRDEALGNTCRLLTFSKCLEKACPASLEECKIFKYGSVDASQCHLLHKDGRQVPVIKNARVVNDETGQAIGVVETITDLTDLMAARRKMEEAAWKLGEKHQFGNIIGKSHTMQEVFDSIKAAAASEAAIIIQGESGTGKELVAGAIHYNSDRASRPLVTVNCSALSESLLESELFGHVKGAFTGAHRERAGRFEEADKGTIFLDEIGEISPFIQVKLLRVLQEHEIERVGESKKRKTDIRVITATHQNLYQLVREGKFREDLYYRLKVFPIHIPALEKRKEDIPVLADHFIDKFNKKTGKNIKGLDPSALRIMMDYHWPGNVRELENAVEHAFVLCTQDMIDVFDLPVEIRKMSTNQTRIGVSPPLEKENRPEKKLTRNELVNLLRESRWNKAEAGRRLGLSRTSIWKYMKKWDIPLKDPE